MCEVPPGQRPQSEMSRVLFRMYPVGQERPVWVLLAPYSPRQHLDLQNSCAGLFVSSHLLTRPELSLNQAG